MLKFTLYILCSIYLFGVPLILSGQNSNLQFLNEIKNKQDFDNLKGKPLSNNYNGIKCIKIVYVLATKKLYYIESVKYSWHYSFTSQVLFDEDFLDVFNSINYSQSSSRKYILATFNYNTNTKNYFLQFAPPDDISDELITTLCQKITESFFKKSQFKVLLNTTSLLKRKQTLEKKLDVITGDEIYKSQKYQSIYNGKTNGRLLFIDADSIKQQVDYSNCILVINGNSNNIPVCKGILINEFQTPLSHICLLTMNRKTPCAFQKNCFSNDSLIKFKNKYVQFTVLKTKATFKLIQENEIKTRISKKITLPIDTNSKKCSYLKFLSIKNIPAFGSKVCNLAELYKLETKGQQISTPPHAFAIPFYYYYKHIKNNQIDIDITEMINEQSISKNDSILTIRLKKIRQKIIKLPLDTTLINQITKQCFKHFGDTKVRFRSSSNCEDRDNFNGAGLYNSITGIHNDSIKTYEKAIKKVWASLWNYRAYKERDYFNFNHESVMMGVLVHQVYDNELINGVAITKNLYRDYEAGIVINIQKGENEVVSPKNGVISEQIISYMSSGFSFYDDSKAADWLSYSSLNPNSSLLTTEELLTLSRQLESIKRYFYELYHAWPKKRIQRFCHGY